MAYLMPNLLSAHLYRARIYLPDPNNGTEGGSANLPGVTIAGEQMVSYAEARAEE